MSASFALELKGVHKSFGSHAVLTGLDMAVPKGAICGFVGANGAGKTTTYSLIAGFVRCKKGTILIDGQPLKRYLSQGNLIGVLPQDMLFFETRTISRQLYLFARLAGFSGAKARKEVDRVLEAVSLRDKAKVQPHKLSRGMRVRLGIAQALIGSPKLILLDEPMAGLDPRMKISIREITQSLKSVTTFIISSHELGELEEFCDYYCILNRGKLAQSGGKDQILRQSGRVHLRVNIAPDLFKRMQLEFKGYTMSLHKKDLIELQYQTDKETLGEVNTKVLSWLLKEGVEVLEVHTSKSLEKAYLEATT